MADHDLILLRLFLIFVRSPSEDKIILVEKSKINDFLDFIWIFGWMMSQIVDIFSKVAIKFFEDFIMKYGLAKELLF